MQAFSAVVTVFGNCIGHLKKIIADFRYQIADLFRIPQLKIPPHILIRIDFFFLGVNAHGIHFHIPAITQIA